MPDPTSGTYIMTEYVLWACEHDSDADEDDVPVCVSQPVDLASERDAAAEEGLPCGPTAGAYCTGNPSEKCVYDTSCSDDSSPLYMGGLGCNAGGVGQNCRFCGPEGPHDCSRAAIRNLPPGANYTLWVEARTEAGSSGNASVAGGDGQAGPVFTTHALPLQGNAPFGAQTAGLDNESSVHAMWWPPYGNGLPLLSHELLIDSGATDEASLVAAAELEAVCDGSGSGGAYVDTGCWHPIDADPSCGAAGHPLCRLCVAGADCPPRGALAGAEALEGGGLRLTLPATATGPMQAVLNGLPGGSLHTAHVRAINARGYGPFSPEGTLATGGEPPVLLSTTDSALTAAAAGGASGGVVLIAVCVGLTVLAIKLHRSLVFRRRTPDKPEEKVEEVAGVDQSSAAADSLWAMLESPFSASEVPGVDDSEKVEVSRVLAYLAREQQKQEKEDKRAEAAAKSKKPQQQKAAAAEAGGTSKKSAFRAGAAGKLKFDVTKGGAATGANDAEARDVAMYLMRTHGVDTLRKPADNDKRVLQAQWSSRYQRASELAAHQTPEELHGFDAGTAQAVHEARNRMRPSLHARERLPALLRTTLLLSQVRGEHQKEIDKRRGESADAMEFDEKGRMIVKKEANGKRGTSRPSKRATINPTGGRSSAVSRSSSAGSTGDDSGRKSGLGAAGKSVAAANKFADGSADGEKKVPKLQRRRSAFDISEETTRPEKTARERAPSARRRPSRGEAANTGAAASAEASTNAPRATTGAYLEPSDSTPAKEPSKKPAGLGLSLNLAAAPPDDSVTNI